jgi:malonyl-CoA O-methyltransferase
MNAVREFTRFAASYGRYNIIQKYAAEKLVGWIKTRNLGTVLDVGCGEGEIYRQIVKKGLPFDYFIATDLSEKMLELHPAKKNVQCLRADFNSDKFAVKLRDISIDTLISSSALQWSSDLFQTAEQLSSLGARTYVSLFTDGTFETLLGMAGVESPVLAAEKVEKILSCFFEIRKSEKVSSRLEFASVREMFRYIKKSGVSGGEARLDYRRAKNLLETYPLDYLEFELFFAILEPKKSFSRA